ncbi:MULTISPECIES: type II toxin-antitoxin system RelB/DinJ family antitoxin [Methylobacterium]|jgi:DNA-damage-inducible protein J|uniref:type II toxin-antitoxin system RelB/DinJ family antitoxin n=1 Tax=Methylobacterium TaxID=407 RepID=UPI0011C9F8A4|nr:MULTISPECIES: type II toxin-antitoxin system RelB/DinJ family antitoxin [Methylobacterium]TXN48436.1 type II toxin-antitoxin system RelB/DinJ family antitoxin [Methylobacterium sp. WL7]TXN67548.1 type II toxin-antitoxin system RelB/DinJ family antitoxin [Methylobacterium sp. WL18]GJE19759.1 hypothetical protein JHFBIEKO_0177 [Methylobacterium mesophilicum]
MADTLIQASIDSATEEESAAVLATIGLTVSDAVRLMLVRVARDRALPFEPLIPNQTTLAAMEEARRGGLVRFDSVAALMADLDADG